MKVEMIKLAGYLTSSGKQHIIIICIIQIRFVLGAARLQESVHSPQGFIICLSWAVQDKPSEQLILLYSIVRYKKSRTDGRFRY